MLAIFFAVLYDAANFASLPVCRTTEFVVTHHVSLTRLVSGQAQQGFSFLGSSLCGEMGALSVDAASTLSLALPIVSENCRSKRLLRYKSTSNTRLYLREIVVCIFRAVRQIDVKFVWILYNVTSTNSKMLKIPAHRVKHFYFTPLSRYFRSNFIDNTFVTR